MNLEYENVINIIKEAGKLVTRNLRFNREISVKSFANFVTDLDYKVEKLITERLKEISPYSNIVTEESYNNFVGSNRNQWILDPIDGTTNLIHKYPHVAISLSLMHDSEIIFGVIYNPIAKELFYAEKDKGAYLNNKKIHVSQNKLLDRCIVGFGLPYNREKTREIFKKVEEIFSVCQDVKRKGPAALDIAYVACGRLDAYFEMDLQPWDFSAGKLLLEEAGGTITQWSGEEITLSRVNNVLATNGYVHKQLSKELNLE